MGGECCKGCDNPVHSGTFKMHYSADDENDPAVYFIIKPAVENWNDPKWKKTIIYVSGTTHASEMDGLPLQPHRTGMHGADTMAVKMPKVVDHDKKQQATHEPGTFTMCPAPEQEL